MIFIEKIENKNSDNNGIFYTSKQPLISCKDESCEYEDLLDFYFKHSGKNKIKPNIIDYECEKLEIDIFPYIYEKILKAIKLKGDIICKLYETFTFNSIKLISKLVKTYENVYICKPLTSKLYDSEKFVICCNFLKECDEIVNMNVFNQIKNLDIKTLNNNSKIYRKITSA